MVLPDNDEPGRKHAEQVAAELADHAKSIRVVELPGLPKSGDVTDWLETNTVSELERLVTRALRHSNGGSAQADNEAALTAEPESRLELRWASDVKMKRTRWVLDGWWPLGGLSILAGFGGLGKSTYIAYLAAQLTQGTAPGDFYGIPTSVLILTAEDVWASTLVPRLRAAGADLERIAFLAIKTNQPDEEPVPGTVSLPADLPKIEETLDQGGFSLICLDPLVSFLDGDTDSHKDASVRLVLDPLNLLAARYGIGVLGNMHFNKSDTKDPYKKLSSSAAFWNAPRAVAFLGQEHGSSRTDPYRYLAAAKNNLAPQAQSIKYRIDETEVHGGSDEESAVTSKLQYIAQSEIEVHELFSGHQDASTRDELAEDIVQLLRENEGVVAREAVEDLAKNRYGVVGRTVGRAIQAIGGAVFKPKGQEFDSKTWWVRGEWINEQTATDTITTRDDSTTGSGQLGANTPSSQSSLLGGELEGTDR